MLASPRSRQLLHYNPVYGGFWNFPLGKPLDGMSGGPFHVEKVDLSY